MNAKSTKRRGTLVELSVVKVSPYLRVEKPLLWLCEKEVNAPRLLPIAIGEFEAAAIQMKLDHDEPLRPISYDLFTAMLDGLKATLRQIVIHSIDNATFYATVFLEVDGKLRELDARPSDAVAMALRSDVPLYTTGQVLDIAGYTSEGSVETAIERFYELEPQIVDAAFLPDTDEPAKLNNPDISAPDRAITDNNLGDNDKLTELRNLLEIAVICEEYETAATLRDEIARTSTKEL